MDLIILNDGLYHLIPVTKKMLEGVELFNEINCFDLCDILRLKLTGYVDTLNLHIMNDGTGSMIGCLCRYISTSPVYLFKYLYSIFFTLNSSFILSQISFTLNSPHE